MIDDFDQFRDDVNRKLPENFGFWLKFSEPLPPLGISASTSTESANFRQSVPKRNSVVQFRSHIAVIFAKISAFFMIPNPSPPIFGKIPNFSGDFILRSSLKV